MKRHIMITLLSGCNDIVAQLKLFIQFGFWETGCATRKELAARN